MLTKHQRRLIHRITVDYANASIHAALIEYARAVELRNQVARACAAAKQEARSAEQRLLAQCEAIAAAKEVH